MCVCARVCVWGGGGGGGGGGRPVCSVNQWSVLEPVDANKEIGPTILSSIPDEVF